MSDALSGSRGPPPGVAQAPCVMPRPLDVQAGRILKIRYRGGLDRNGASGLLSRIHDPGWPDANCDHTKHMSSRCNGPVMYAMTSPRYSLSTRRVPSPWRALLVLVATCCFTSGGRLDIVRRGPNGGGRVLSVRASRSATLICMYCGSLRAQQARHPSSLEIRLRLRGGMPKLPTLHDASVPEYIDVQEASMMEAMKARMPILSRGVLQTAKTSFF